MTSRASSTSHQAAVSNLASTAAPTTHNHGVSDATTRGESRQGVAHEHHAKSRMAWLTKERRLYGVIIIAFAFLIAELIIGFTNNALVLIADAFHISSDLIGYVVSVICIRLGNKSGEKKRDGWTFGMQRAELLGAAFNGVFLLALGVSVILQSVDRFINPSELDNAVLVAIIGGAGIASNFLMVLLLGGHTHSHGHGVALNQLDNAGEHVHASHAHFTRPAPKTSRFDLNILGVLLHIIGDGINSLAVIISAVVYLKTGWIYMDPIASLFVGFMIIGTALPLTLRSGRMLAQAAPRDIDLKGLYQDVAAVEGVKGVHELHVWSLTQTKAIAALHLTVASDSLTAFMKLSQKIQSCLHFWGVHAVTIQPELADPDSDTDRDSETEGEGDGATRPAAPQIPATGSRASQVEESTCRLRCPSQLCDEACC